MHRSIRADMNKKKYPLTKDKASAKNTFSRKNKRQQKIPLTEKGTKAKNLSSLKAEQHIQKYLLTVG
jgi:hypothetical protein